MLLNKKIIASLQSEIKKQKALLKTITSQEQDYHNSYEDVKRNIMNSIEYMERILNEVK